MTPAVQHSSFDWHSLPCALQVFTVLAAVLFLLYVICAYGEWGKRNNSRNAEERALGVSAVSGFITVGIASASILLAATGVLLAFEPGHSRIPTKAFTDLAIATVWLVISLISGAFAAAWTVNHVHHQKSVAEHPLVMTASSAQFIALILGAVYFVVAVFLF
jgi:hypothetical protein